MSADVYRKSFNFFVDAILSGILACVCLPLCYCDLPSTIASTCFLCTVLQIFELTSVYNIHLAQPNPDAWTIKAGGSVSIHGIPYTIWLQIGVYPSRGALKNRAVYLHMSHFRSSNLPPGGESGERDCLLPPSV